MAYNSGQTRAAIAGQSENQTSGAWWDGFLTLSPFKLLSGLSGVALAALVIYPLIRIGATFFIVNGRLDAGSIAQVASLPGVGRVVLSTLAVVFSSMCLALTIGTVFAWLMERTDARIRSVEILLPMVPFLLPPISGAIGWTFLLSERSGYLNSLMRAALSEVGIHLDVGPLNVYSWWGMIALYTIYQIPFGFLMVSAGLRNSDPSLDEQARVSGASILATLVKVTLPAILPSIGAASLFTIWFGLSFFSVPAVIGPQAHIDTIAVKIVELLTFTYPAETTVAMGLSGFLLLAMGVVWWLQARMLANARYATLAGKGYRTITLPLRRWRRPAQAALVLYCLIALVLPLGAHVLVCMRGFWSAYIDWTKLRPANLLNAFSDGSPAQEAFAVSIRLALAGATITVLLAATQSLHNQSTRGWVARVINGVIKLPAALSPVIIGIGFLLAFSGPPFSLGGTSLILLLCYIVLFIPQATTATDAAVAQIDRQLREAAQVAGARPSRVFLKINLPLLLPGLIASWGLLFVWMVGELNASVMLAGAHNPVVGFQILQAFQHGGFAQLASLSVALTFVNVAALTLAGIAGKLGGLRTHSA